MNADQIKAQFPGYAGWNDRAAIEADFRATGGSGKGPSQPSTPSYNAPSTSSSSTPFNYADLAREQMRLTQEANAPVVQSFQQQIPTTQKAFAQTRSELEAQKDPLKTRYQTILDELKRRETVETGTESTRLTREYAARGIDPSSDMFSQGLRDVLRPKQEYYSGQTKDVGLAQTQDVQSLENLISRNPIEQEEATNQINNLIAQLQAGGNKDAITNALNLFQYQQQASTAQAQLANQLKIAGIEAAAKSQPVSVGAGSTLVDPATGKVIFGGSGGGGGNIITTGGGGGMPWKPTETKPIGPPTQQLQTQFGGGVNTNYMAPFQAKATDWSKIIPNYIKY